MCPAGPGQLFRALPCPCSAFHNQFSTGYAKGQYRMQVACVFLAINTSLLASEGTGSVVLFIKVLAQVKQRGGALPVIPQDILETVCNPTFIIILIYCCLGIKKTHKAKYSE